ncbi:MAG: hypothetical protein R3B47_00080 [Bacteroidia bacterium]
MKSLKHIGLGIFLFSMALFVAVVLFSRFDVEGKSLMPFSLGFEESQQDYVREGLVVLNHSKPSMGEVCFLCRSKGSFSKNKHADSNRLRNF